MDVKRQKQNKYQKITLKLCKINKEFHKKNLNLKRSRGTENRYPFVDKLVCVIQKAFLTTLSGSVSPLNHEDDQHKYSDDLETVCMAEKICR